MAPTIDGVNLGTTIGAFLVGVVISAALYGITVVQTYIFFRQSHDDTRLLRYSVFTLCVLDTLHQVLLTVGLWTYAISDYGNPQAVSIPDWTLIAALVVSALMAVIIKLHFCSRVWHLSGRNKMLIFPMVFFTFSEFVCSNVFAGLASTINDFDDFNKITPNYYVGAISGMIADLLIATSQVVMLWTRRTGFKKTDNVLSTLMVYSINTGLLTSAVAFVALVSFATMKDNLIYVAVYHEVSKLLLNAFLATYNARGGLRNQCQNSGDLVTIPLSTIPVDSSTQRSHFDRKIEISVDTSTNIKVDTPMSKKE
ncbi:hypothetical protein CERSUDRAFT_83124 [Gelatoporia subvermispora B]|uniref:DUF6534 domain-containing protein n=1 Tax=Ceriporiopsis subvermispora (strain B) TaxID=914234 RepID=M2REU6_CERS8|nr:hypothetical protein CERSUDRAFT_83124 [Gelatoporia subvermispora B]